MPASQFLNLNDFDGSYVWNDFQTASIVRAMTSCASSSDNPHRRAMVWMAPPYRSWKIRHASSSLGSINRAIKLGLVKGQILCLAFASSPLSLAPMSTDLDKILSGLSKPAVKPNRLAPSNFHNLRRVSRHDRCRGNCVAKTRLCVTQHDSHTPAIGIFNSTKPQNSTRRPMNSTRVDFKRRPQESTCAIARKGVNRGRQVRIWWNWQTRYFEVVVPQGVQVQILLSAPKIVPKLSLRTWPQPANNTETAPSVAPHANL